MLPLSWNAGMATTFATLATMLERIRQSTACRVATEEVGGEILGELIDTWEVRDVDVMRWQHGAVEMKETLADFVCRTCSGTVGGKRHV